MSYALKVDGAWVEILGDTVELADRVVSAGWVAGLSDDERAELGFAAIAETDPPAGVKAAVASVADVAGVPTRSWAGEAYTDADLAALAAAKVAAVHVEAKRRIDAIVDQRTLNRWFGRAFKLLLTVSLDPADWPADDQALLTQALAAQAAAEALEAAEAAIAAAVPTDDAAAIAAFDVAGNADWPVS